MRCASCGSRSPSPGALKPCLLPPLVCITPHNGRALPAVSFPESFFIHSFMFIPFIPNPTQFCFFPGFRARPVIITHVHTCMCRRAHLYRTRMAQVQPVYVGRRLPHKKNAPNSYISHNNALSAHVYKHLHLSFVSQSHQVDYIFQG